LRLKKGLNRKGRKEDAKDAEEKRLFVLVAAYHSRHGKEEDNCLFTRSGGQSKSSCGVCQVGAGTIAIGKNSVILFPTFEIPSGTLPDD